MTVLFSFIQDHGLSVISIQIHAAYLCPSNTKSYYMCPSVIMSVSL